MAQDQTPRLVKPDGERMAPADAPLTLGNAFEMFKALLAENRASAEESARIQAEAFASAQLAMKKKLDEEAESEDQKALKSFKNRSVFNPYAEDCRPRPEIKGEIAWLGTPCLRAEQTREEIELLNQLQPGLYHNGEWKVIDQTPGVKGSRKLLVMFPCMDPDQRAALPGGYTDPQTGRFVTGMEQMLREMVTEHARRTESVVA